MSTSQKSNSGRPKCNSAVCRSAAHETIGADATLVSQFKRTFVEIIRFIFELIRLRASCTISWRKPSFGIKIVQSGFTEDVQWLISAEKAWIYYTVIFVPDLIKYVFLGVSLWDAKIMGGEYYT